MFDKTAVVIPAFNAEKTIKQVICTIETMIPLNQIIVVDDGSEDQTGKKAKEAGVFVLRHPQNRGKGAALKTGITSAAQNGWQYVITIDADGQHDPNAIPSFLTKEEGDIIIGARNHSLQSTPWPRYLSNKITSLILSLIVRQQIADSQSGYRLIRSELIQMFPLLSQRYEMESEILIRAGRLGFSIDAIRVKTIYSNHNLSHIQPVRDTWRFVVMVFKSFFW